MIKRATSLFIFIILMISSMNLFGQIPIITKQPHSHGVIVGQKATFFVLASGTGLTYQWYLNDTPIGGATDSVYVTPTTTLAHNGEQFYVIVSNISGKDTSKTAILYVTASGSRVTASQVALYNFKEGKGNIINDVSGFGTPVNLTIHNPSFVDWSRNGLYVNDNAMIYSSIGTKIKDAIIANDEITVELWIRPLSIKNDRIFDFAAVGNQINFEVGRYPLKKGYNILLRTTNTDEEGIPGTVDTSGLNTALTQVLFTFKDGIVKVYENGDEITSENIGGDLFKLEE